MVSISLRAYVNEINDMVDQHQIDEAIAHCRHILEKYPKHVDTYRLLGKAYLEEQRYGDAADILQRVLSSVPEDFISQVGMSIIREDEGNLDSAIYHMERAFETQPSNHAIQSELRRLNTKRDGIELTRVRLTRGALARMYAHGNLYDQAISELLAALSEDPNRFDLQNLLAEMYYKTDKKVDAAETCTKILEKLPYCINANQLLTQILEESGRPEEAQRYRQRWADLDPYAKYIGEEYALIDTVPDNSVTLEHLEWDPSGLYKEADQPAWASSLGLAMDGTGDSGDELPDWLGQSADPDDPFGTLRPTEMLPEDEVDPLFGDKPEVIDGNRIGLIPQAEDDAPDQEDDWLSDLDQPEADITQESEPAPFSPDAEEPTEGADDWLASLDAPDEEPAPAGDDQFPADTVQDGAEDWLASLESPDEEPAPAGDDLFPIDTEQEGAEDWLASLDTPDEEPAPAGDDLFPTDEGDDDSDAWLASLEEKAAETLPTTEETPAADPEAELPDFLKDAGWETGTGEVDESSPLDLDGEDQLAEAEIPDWIQEMAPEAESTEEAEDLKAEADPEWMKSLEAPASGPAEWLAELDEQDEQPESPEVEAQPEARAEEMAPGQEIEADEMDMAWLENLAAKQGIPDEEMTTSAEQRAEVTEEDAPEFEQTGAELDLPDTLQEQPSEEEAGDTDWLKQIGLSESEEQEEPAEEEMGDDTGAWLESVKEEEEAAPEVPHEDTITRFLAAKEVPGQEDQPEEPTEEESADDWLAEAFSESDEPAVSEDGTEISTDWLKAIGQEAAEEAGAIAESEPVEEVSPVDEEEDSFDPSWLEEISEEAAQEAAGEPVAEAPAPVEEAEAESDDSWLSELGAAEEETPAEEAASDDWLASLGAEEETAEELVGETPATEDAASPVDEEEDSFDTSWLSQIGEEAAQEAAEEPVAETPAPVEEAESDDSWLSELGATEEEIPAEEAASDDWLADLGAAEEAAEEPVEQAAESDDSWLSELSAAEEETPAEETDDDWLAELGAEEEAAEEPVAETPAEATSPVDEEEDDFDMDWLDQISDEASQEAGGAEAVPATPLDLDEDDLDMAWLDEISDEAAQEAAEEPAAEAEETPAADDWMAELEAEEEETPAPAEDATPVDEEADSFDPSWLEEISEEAAQEAAEEPIAETPAPEAEEAPAADDWMAEPGAEEEETPAPTEAATPVDEEADNFDTSWLADISEEAAQEAAEELAAETPAPEAEEATAADDWMAELATEDEEAATPAEIIASTEEEEDDLAMDWLADISEEAAKEAAEELDTETPSLAKETTEEDDWLAKIEAEDDLQHGDTISNTDAWLLSMEEEDAAPETPEEPVTDSDEWLSSIGIQPDEDQVEPEIADVIEESQPEAPPEPEITAADTVQPTQAEEWLPESAVQPEPVPAEPQPDPLADKLSAARQSVQDNDLDTAMNGYAEIIKKGKLLEEVIDDLNQALTRHPINARLWQALGDAHLRMDNLQDALDAYSKAEDLLR